METKYPLATVGALVRSPSGHVLLVKTTKWRGFWGVPGGKIEWGETMEAALKREFAEEVGLELFNIRYALTQEAVLDNQFHKPAHFILLNFFADTLGQTVRPNEEIAEWAWVEAEKAFDYELNTFTRVLIEAYLHQNISTPSVMETVELLPEP